MTPGEWVVGAVYGLFLIALLVAAFAPTDQADWLHDHPTETPEDER